MIGAQASSENSVMNRFLPQDFKNDAPFKISNSDSVEVNKDFKRIQPIQASTKVSERPPVTFPFGVDWCK